MRKILVPVMAVLFVCSLSVVLAQRTLAAQAQPEQAAQPAAFTGTVVTAHMKGGLGNPHLILDVIGDDGVKVSFVLRKHTTVTDVEGKNMDPFRPPKKGKKVEIKYEVKSGQNEALSMHYLD
jgi:hypothetical protein